MKCKVHSKPLQLLLLLFVVVVVVVVCCCFALMPLLTLFSLLCGVLDIAWHILWYICVVSVHSGPTTVTDPDHVRYLSVGRPFDGASVHIENPAEDGQGEVSHEHAQ